MPYPESCVWIKAQARKFLKNAGCIRQGDVYKVLALQVCSPEFNFQNPFNMLDMYGSTHLQSRDWRDGGRGRGGSGICAAHWLDSLA